MDIAKIKARKINIDGQDLTLGELVDDDAGAQALHERLNLARKLKSQGSGEADYGFEDLFTPPPAANKKGAK